MRGLLYEKGIITKRHSGLKEMFGLHYVRTGAIPKQYAQDLEMLFNRRRLIDYEVDGELPIKEVDECIHAADDFLTFVKTNYA